MGGMAVLVSSTGQGQCGSHHKNTNQQAPILELLIAAIRKSIVACRVDASQEVIVMDMDISLPTNVRHITHVTFDRFNGFLGLPVEFQLHVPSKVPSASVSVFGVSADSMHCSYDSKGNSIPTILLLMQHRLYSNGGLKAEGIFRINPDDSEENIVRDRLNTGVVPDDIDVHCLAGLIKAWFRELPSGILDGLSPERVLHCNTEEDSIELIKHLKPTESALLKWAVELMADVVEEEELNKMNARNIAMVFAPNMTRMSDPLTALMHAVQVMNLLKTLIIKTLREREEEASVGYSTYPSPSCYSGPPSEDELDCLHVLDMVSNYTRPSIVNECTCTHLSDEGTGVLCKIEDCFLQHLTEQVQEIDQSNDITYKSFSVMSSSSASSSCSASSFRATDEDSGTVEQVRRLSQL